MFISPFLLYKETPLWISKAVAGVLSPEHQYIGDDRRRRSSGISISDKLEPSMTDVKITMIDGDGNSSEECCERIEMRCLAADNTRRWEKRREPEVLNPEASGGKRSRRSGSDPPPPLPPSPTEQASPTASYSETRSTTSPVVSSAEEEESPDPAISSGSSSSSANPPVAFGLVSLSGRSRVMEDAVSVRPGFYRRQDGSPVDFFAVFDGHGGSHVSALCKERMHVVLSQELAGPSESPEEDTWRAAVARGFSRMDELALAACACGRVAPPACACEWSGFKSDIVGSTAVVAMVASDCILLANCGDSRAVLSRGGQAIPLSDDHKPDRPDELARIEAAGGRVIYVNGARVHGILAMSRALGDKYLKPEVISDPEIKIVERTSTDECLIIASDGLWDVIPNDLACDVARRCLEESDPARDDATDLNSRTAESAVAAEEEEQVQESDSKCSLAAALLARLALGRMSADNISVIVVDLRRRM